MDMHGNKTYTCQTTSVPLILIEIMIKLSSTALLKHNSDVTIYD